MWHFYKACDVIMFYQQFLGEDITFSDEKGGGGPGTFIFWKIGDKNNSGSVEGECFLEYTIF